MTLSRTLSGVVVALPCPGTLSDPVRPMSSKGLCGTRPDPVPHPRPIKGRGACGTAGRISLFESV